MFAIRMTSGKSEVPRLRSETAPATDSHDPEVGDQSDKREAFITEVLPSVQGQLLVRAKETPCARLAGAHHERKPREVRANVTNDGAPVFAIDRGEITAGSTPPKAKTAIAAAPRMHDQILRANVRRNPTTDAAVRYRL